MGEGDGRSPVQVLPDETVNQVAQMLTPPGFLSQDVQAFQRGCRDEWRHGG